MAGSSSDVRGVNLGGLFLLEAWMQRSLFASASKAVQDEFSLCQELTHEQMAAHRREWITMDDLLQIKALGLNSVRVPFGYWLLDPPGGIDRKPAPPHTGARSWLATAKPYMGPDEPAIAALLDACAKVGLRVNLDLHGAPGGQSERHTCGFHDDDWQPDSWDDEATVRCLEHVARVWGGHPALDAITVLNEPSNRISAGRLVAFYVKVHDAIRRHDPTGRITIVYPVYQRPYVELSSGEGICNLFSGRGFPSARLVNVALDAHLYHCFGDGWQQTALDRQLETARSGEGHWPCVHELPDRVGRLVSEWSLRLPSWDHTFPVRQHLEEKGAEERARAHREFAAAQIAQYECAGAGWFFWTWKVDCGAFFPDAVDDEGPWDFRECLSRGWIDAASCQSRRA
jgi:glucan 1,3-beta-glucosidase